ncbi:hypothetical protein C4D16_RS17615 [Vibrio parahaemolyticus]|uniref:hypothetical protein n=1 Tax=Vibrio parahaemolyticus TaxID=670 RepID=UPI00079FDAF6|nr:hypothetical protein [Vibrio parahaemolyticus]EJG0412290.1 hypothetical protein [Vibrio parahaemolyticus]KYY38641.1 hypothetical protein AWQ12_06935 [Vibrio parahaemolyticus]
MYQQKEKNIARAAVIGAAISSLCSEREGSTLASRDHMRKVRNELISRGDQDQYAAQHLTNATVERWEKYYDSIIQSKKPENLKIAYLSGPNPENDLREMTKLGVLPENIWAFESHAQTYNDAVVSALSSEFPFIKLIKAGVSDFFQASPQKFDIIYLDFCGPLPSKSKKHKTLKTISNILSYHTLNSPGSLITNVCLPTEEQDSESRKLLAKLVGLYLYPKSFLECSEHYNNVTEGALAHGYDLEEWLEIVESDLDNYYGEYITRLLIDMVLEITPYDRLSSNHVLFKNLFDISDKTKLKQDIESLFKYELSEEERAQIEQEMHQFTISAENFFDYIQDPSIELDDVLLESSVADSSLEDEEDEEDDGIYAGVVLCEPNCHSLLWTLGSLSQTLNKKDSFFPDEIHKDSDFKQYAQQFILQLSSQNDEKTFIDNICKASFLLSEGNGEDKFHSHSMKKLEGVDWINQYYQFCDYFLFHQVKEVLFRQLAVPYHVNVEATKRWKYTAKDTPMYMDMLILDECRYLYDWMPTIDMMKHSLTDIERQLSFRFVLDAISKHRRYLSTEVFYGTACVGEKKGFEAKILEPRREI